MKVAMVVWRFPQVSETFILNQITGLIDRGSDVDIYAYSPGGMPQVHPQVDAYQLLKRTHYSPPQPRKQRLTGLITLATSALRNPILPLRALRNRADIAWTVVCEARTLLRRGPYDVVHCQFAPLGLRYGGLHRVGALQGRFVTSFRGYDISSYVQEFGQGIYRRLFDAGDLFLPNCEFFKHRLIQLGCSEERIVVHPSGIDCNVFPFIPRRLAPGDHVRIVTIGRYVEKKGIEYAIRAVAKLAQEYPLVEHSIVGDGPLRGTFERLITTLGAGRTITLLGWKRQDEVVELLKTSHIMLAPGVTAANGDQEATPNILKEAMAMGVPVVSTWHAGIPELVEDGVSGFLVPERDVDALVAKLRLLIEHPELWPAMGRAGRTRVEEQYNIESLSDRLVDIYRQRLPPRPS